ncbi:zinc ribbon domain-containing protein [Paenibacillus piri]|uniref:Zinc ribbon domain-containing protein n=1 Tax=Paenibacillus piri TaxID=2547395 RepID=A0A4R5KGH9_9BACL|nr:zinc ribbon domain-containing protein [Paenibacillus piri]TDF93805.1 zinc ribbon domain-containing protein [Paenibacillus piri]
MATIVLHKPTGRRYVLIGTGFLVHRSGRQGGNPSPWEDPTEIPAAAVSDSHGRIVWLPTEELQVIEVDGKRIGSYFTGGRGRLRAAAANASVIPEERCPACQFRIAANTKECPSCGLTLISEEPI